MIRSRVAPLILLASYNKNGHTDAGGHFELHGLPSMEGQLRAIDPRLPIRSGTCLADVKASSGPRIEVSPAFSPGSQVHELLGMKLLEIDSQVQAKLGLAKPYGLLVVDPGPRSQCLGFGKLQAGDCIFAFGDEKPGLNFATFARRLSALCHDPNHQGHIQFVAEIGSWNDSHTAAGRWEMNLTQAQISELERNSR